MTLPTAAGVTTISKVVLGDVRSPAASQPRRREVLIPAAKVYAIPRNRTDTVGGRPVARQRDDWYMTDSSITFRPSYELAQGPPAVAWSDYIANAWHRWTGLLNDPATTEPDLQVFMEQNPSFVPGAFGVRGPANHGPTIGALITQPRLPRITRPVPDFMWINKQSDRIFAVLVEIENPRKRWFNAKGITTPELNEAKGQIADWKAWFA